MPGNRLYLKVLVLLALAVVIAVFQDYLQSIRHGRSFYADESLLFKAVWFVFPPIFYCIKREVDKSPSTSYLRLLTILLCASLAHVLSVPLIIWFLSSVFRELPYGFMKVLTFTLSSDLVKILLVHSAFIVYVLHTKATKKQPPKDHAQTNIPQKDLPPFASEPESISIKSGKQHHVIRLTDIIYIKSETPYVSIQLQDKHYLHLSTLKSIAEQLNSRFIQVHRSCIVNLDCVCSYESRLNGDYDLTLTDGSAIRLSRNYVKAFKHHFDFASV